MRFVLLSSSFALALALGFGCAATPNNIGFGNSGSGNSGSGNSGSGNSGTGGGTGSTTDTGIGGNFTGTTSGNTNCSAAAELVYVLSTSNELYSFDPGQKQFKLIGTLNCNVPSTAQPNSMAVDRDANAWVNYVDSDPVFGTDSAGWVYKVSTANASCASSASVTLPSASWYRLGMGFSSDTAGGSTETLYVAGTGMAGSSNSPGLGKIDLSTFALAPIGQFSGDNKLTGQSAELTGTGDARLFGFFTTTPVRVAQLNKSSGAVMSDWPVSGLATPLAWAFSFWGGSFYLYTSDGTSNSTVTKFDPSTMAVDTSYVLTAPTVIDGAGVSTCAPLTPPQ